ncbi:hypothetical protein EYF80_036406 [Liparis tanakae]|uniref:Uncharacterized protein n=1 Tax=Liparis tanakae TaxID=230148 RepID=A0A4Z2GJG7_9TELE|nr:hypothetical protein EYF80_036406 [Liparis tanakae]
MSVLVTPYFSEALRNWEICSICLKAAVELWIFFTGFSAPGLEAHLSGLWLRHAGAALTADPLHQHQLQLGVVLAVDLVLDVPAHAEGGTFVSHADSLRETEEGRDTASQ